MEVLDVAPGSPLTDDGGGPSSPRTRDHRFLRLAGPLVMLALAAAFRLTALEADPPATLSDDFISDESWWAHNARNHALFGRWRLDDFNQGLFAAPLHTVMERISFAAGGVSLRQARLVSALAGLATVFLIGTVLRREEGFRASMAGMGILTFDYFTLSYDRSGFVEPLPTAFMCLSILLATLRDRWRVGLALSGVAALLACLAKINSVFFLATPLAWILIRPRAEGEVVEPRSRRNDVLSYLAGIAVPAMIYGALFVAPNLGEYLSQNGRLRDESKIHGPLVLLNLLTFSLKGDGQLGLSLSGFLSESLLPTLLGLLWLVHFLSRASRIGFRTALRSLTGVERIALAWIVGLCPYFVLQDNNQERRYYVFVAPLAMLGAHLFAHRRREPIEIRTADLHPVRAAIVVVGCIFVVLLYVRAPAAVPIARFFRDIPIGEKAGLSNITLSFLATVLVVAVSLPILWAALLVAPRSRWSVMTAALIIGVAGGTIQCARIAGYAGSMSYTLDRASRDFASRLGDGARVVNGHPFIMGTRCRDLITLDRSYLGYPHYGLDFLDEFGATHVLLGGELDEPMFAQRLRDSFGDRFRAVPRSLKVFAACPDGHGGMRVLNTLARVEPIPVACVER